ncbi:MAG: RodZ domain-containing protein [Caldimonas sp.]
MTGTATGPETARSPGRLLREARERQGLHIAALAASIKVAPKKLELLEADRFDELPDASFTRALAQTVCRALKIDSVEILRLLPPPGGHRLEQLGEGLNAPFRERPGTLVQRDGSSLTVGPAFWITGLILVAALAVYFLPPGALDLARWHGNGAVKLSDAGGAASAAVVAPGAIGAGTDAVGITAATSTAASAAASPLASELASTVASGDAQVAAIGSDAAAGPEGRAAEAATDGVIQVRTSVDSWIDITDARGRSLVSRVVRPGEVVGLDGEAPFRVRIGNASGTRLSFRGQPMRLESYTRDNIARLDLK